MIKLKGIVIILTFILSISVIGLTVEGQAHSGKTIRVFGTVSIDGEGVNNADITVTDTFDDDSASTTTNSTGFYEVFIFTKNDRIVRVDVSFDDFENDKSFEVEEFQTNYEVNFEFEGSPTVIVVSKIVDWFFGVDLKEFLVIVILILFVCLLFLKIAHFDKR